jgi:uncharacterized membrane protein
MHDASRDAQEHHSRTHIHETRTVGEWAADVIAAFVGSWRCVLLHAVWFTLWFLLRLDINLLTLVVSLEAIFLCTFLLMSQNRQSTKDHVRDDHEAVEVDEMFQINQRQLVILEQQNEILALLQDRERAGAITAQEGKDVA